MLKERDMAIKSQRIYGLDLFRIFSMFCVIVLHLLTHGGAINGANTDMNFAIVWFWGTIAYPAVDCFVLLSGFVGYREEKPYPKISNLLAIIFSTLFYSIICSFACAVIFSQEISVKQLVLSALPIYTKQYWFVSAYVGMFLLSAFINLFVNKADKKMLLLASLVVGVYAVPSLLRDPFGLGGGYSTLWFVLLYMLGAIIKKEDVLNKLSAKKSVLCIVAGLVASLGVKLVFHFWGSPLSTYEGILLSYCSPSVLLMAFGWMALFSKIKTAPMVKKAVSLVTPSVFSVYLIHDNPHIRQLLIADRFTFINAYNPVVITAILLAAALVIFVACILIDIVRIWLFKLLHIPQLMVFMEKKMKSYVISRF